MNQQERLLMILIRLQAGFRISKAKLCKGFDLNSRPIQRHVSFLKRVLQEQSILTTDLTIDHSDNSYRLTGKTTFNKKIFL